MADWVSECTQALLQGGGGSDSNHCRSSSNTEEPMSETVFEHGWDNTTSARRVHTAQGSCWALYWIIKSWSGQGHAWQQLANDSMVLYLWVEGHNHDFDQGEFIPTPRPKPIHGNPWGDERYLKPVLVWMVQMGVFLATYCPVPHQKEVLGQCLGSTTDEGNEMAQ